MKIINVVGARPNFIKVSPIVSEMTKHFSKIEQVLVHTGQHYDHEMFDLFFRDLGIPKPHFNLRSGSGTHAQQTAKIMVEFEKILLEERPSLVIVVGDVNSTLACSLVAVKLGIKVAHVEAGLRSFDRSMPEEINRLLTDALSDYLFVTEKSGKRNLLREGISEEKIFFVGNVMIDTLLASRKKAASSTILEKLGLKFSTNGLIDYATLTLHRPSNVDKKGSLKAIFDALVEISKALPIVFPMHPRTRKRIEQFGFEKFVHFIEIEKDQAPPLNPPKAKILTTHPLGYLDFLQLMSKSKMVLTDSGGIQEETCILGIPCVTLRDNTERPITVECGTNNVVGTNTAKIVKASLTLLKNPTKNFSFPPPLWDGKAAKRIVKILVEKLEVKVETGLTKLS